MISVPSVVHAGARRKRPTTLVLAEAAAVFMRRVSRRRPLLILLATPWISEDGPVGAYAEALLDHARRTECQFVLVTRPGSRGRLADAICRYRKGRCFRNGSLHAKLFLCLDRERLLLFVGSSNFTNGSESLDEAGVLLELPPSLVLVRRLVRHLAGRAS